METPVVVNSKVLLWLRKVTALRKLIVDRSLTVKATKHTHLRVKQKQAWTIEETREVIWCCMYCRQHFAGNNKKMYEIWRHHPDSTMYLDVKKLLNQKN